MVGTARARPPGSKVPRATARGTFDPGPGCADPGHDGPVSESIVDRAGLEVLEPAECLRLLAMGGVGRIAVHGEPPVVRPVNFVLDDDRLVIRTGPGSLWRSASQRVLATFEIDGVRNVD